MRVAATIAWKDFLLLLRDPQTTTLLILMPLILAVVVGLAMEGVLDGEARLKVAVVDLDRSDASTEFIERLDESEALVIKTERWDRGDVSRDDAADLLGGGERLAVMVVPVGFAESGGGPVSTIQLYTDPAQGQFSRTIAAIVGGELERGTVAEAVVSIGEEGGLSQDEALGRLNDALQDPPVALATEALTEGTSLPSGFDQTIPGFTVMFAMFIGLFVVIDAFRERDNYGTWNRVLLSPAARPAILGGRLISAYALGAIQMVVLLAIGWLAFGVELGNVGGLAIAVGVFLLAPVAFGLLFISAKNYLLTVSLLNLLVIVLGAIGGSFVPIYLLPGWMETLASFTPHYWALTAFQDLMFRGASIADIWMNLGILAAFAAVFFALGLARFSFAK